MEVKEPVSDTPRNAPRHREVDEQRAAPVTR